ncbi:C2H2 finger domain protein [Xylaria acuta]|nr:C2H2 finger domain protein [Xylaria acuta]
MEMPICAIRSDVMADALSDPECSSMDFDDVEDTDYIFQDSELDECELDKDEMDDDEMDDDEDEMDDDEMDDDEDEIGDDEMDDDEDEIGEGDGKGKTTTSRVKLKRVERQIQRVEATIEDNTLYDGNLKPPEFYRQGIQGLDPENYRRKQYSPKTIRHIDGVESVWRRFCEKILEREDWKEQYLNVTIQILYNFFDWHLNQITGATGKRKRRTLKKNSLVTFWCMFRLAFERQHGFKINQVVDCKEVSNAIAGINTKHGLDHQTRENRSMSLQDLKDQIETTLKTTEKSFKLGELRILAVLFLLFLAPQGARPTSILKLKFTDINLLLVRDPADPGGAPRLLIRLSMPYTKRYLGPKATKHFFIPEIIYNPSLLLSPHVFLLAILFKHRAFLSNSLNNNPHNLYKLRIYPGSNQLRLALKPEFEGTYIFRKPVKGFSGYELSQKRLPTETMSQWVRRIGTLLGFENNTICYNLRYMAGNNLDKDINISDALRNLIMDHAPGSDTFQKHYLNRNVVADLWAIHRNEQPQHALLQQATSHGHSKETRRPIDLTPAQKRAAIDENPEYQRLTQAQKSLPLGARYTEQRKALGLARATLRTSLRNKELKRVRAEWGEAQSVDDIERQIQGVDFSTLPACQPRSSPPMGPLHQQMFDAITKPLDGDLEAHAQRRTNAINALVAYCEVQEAPVNKLIDSQRPSSRTETQGRGKGKCQDRSESQTEDLKRLVSAQDMGGGKMVRKCFICVAKALTMLPTEPLSDSLCTDFSSRASLGRHFTNVHLQQVGEDDETACPLCEVVLEHKMHLQNHAESVHGVKTEKHARK